MFSLSTLNKRFKSNNKLYWFLREYYVIAYSRAARVFDRPRPNTKKRILFYHINSLGFAGTEKFLQILAKHLDKKKYDVFYLYPNKVDENTEYVKRLAYIQEGGVIAIPFDSDKVRPNPPYFVPGMNPDITDVISALTIDLLVVADSGNANYPFSIIRNIPVILLNIFGQPNIQKNISYHVCISKQVASQLQPVVPNRKIKVLPVPSEGPLSGSVDLGEKLREKLGIKNTDIVFGRIGRADDAIYDPIGIEAFKRALESRKDIYYVVMAPPPILRKKVVDEDIQNVYFISPSAKDEDVWAYHASIDALAHFRNDGESFGLNIVESMFSGKPIITHKSHIWNAHLEYLDTSFARITEKDDVVAYTKYILEYADMKKTGELARMGQRAKEKAEKFFLIKNNIGIFEDLIDRSI